MEALVGRVDDIPDGSFKIVKVGSIEIGVTRLGERFYAIANRCPHRGAPLCKGKISGAILPSAPGHFVYGMDDELIKCPWHAYMFELESGHCVLNGLNLRVKTFNTMQKDGELFISI